MEMPPGWQRLYNQDSVIAMSEGETMLMHLKEMAEAIESAIEQNPQASSNLENALNKFKSWK